MREDAPQREHSLRDLLSALRYVVMAGCPWRFLSNDLRPWIAVYQPARRWMQAGVFEQIAQDSRAIVRFLAERDPEPTASIFDGRTLQSTPETGERAGYDGGHSIHFLRSSGPSPSRNARRTQRVTQWSQRVTAGSTRCAEPSSSVKCSLGDRQMLATSRQRDFAALHVLAPGPARAEGAPLFSPGTGLGSIARGGRRPWLRRPPPLECRLTNQSPRNGATVVRSTTADRPPYLRGAKPPAT